MSPAEPSRWAHFGTGTEMETGWRRDGAGWDGGMRWGYEMGGGEVS